MPLRTRSRTSQARRPVEFSSSTLYVAEQAERLVRLDEHEEQSRLPDGDGTRQVSHKTTGMET